MTTLPILDTTSLNGKTALVRMDLNVPMQGGRVTDDTRLQRALPTLQTLLDHRARVIIISHFNRPKGKYEPSMSLAPLVDLLEDALMDAGTHAPVKFSPDCVGTEATEAIASLQPGEVLLLENLRFHAEEETGDDDFAKQLASHADLYVNDAFSCSHRAHASIVGIPQYIPAYAGVLLAQEVEMLNAVCSGNSKPVAAIVGGAKVSSKLALLENLITRVDTLIIGGAMANTFLLAQGKHVGVSLIEKNLVETASRIMMHAATQKCTVILPVDAIVAETLKPHAPSTVCGINAIPKQGMILDIGPKTTSLIADQLAACRVAVWNGPMGAFETSPFDAGTVMLARTLSSLTTSGTLQSIAGGGDTLSAIRHAGLSTSFTYLSTAGGAFLEWLEGKELPGIAALNKHMATPIKHHA